MPVTPAVAGPVPESVRLEKLNVSLWLRYLSVARMRGGRPRFGQSSDLTSDCRSGQLVEQPGDRMLRSSRPQGLRRSDRMLMSALIRRCQENLSNVSEH